MRVLKDSGDLSRPQDLGPIRGAAFDTVAKAERAIQRLLVAGFTDDQVLTICPSKFQEECVCAKHLASSGSAPAEFTKGAATGFALGGLALTATVLTGGVTAPAAGLLLGASAFVGAFSNLIITKGYEVEVPEFVRRPLNSGRIVLGVEVRDTYPAARLEEAQRILTEAGGEPL
jgi:hypothetical protein